MATSSINHSDSRLALLFPGQGAQVVGMGKDLYEGSSAARKIFDKVDEAIGESLTDCMFGGPAEELNRTWNAQPAIMAMSLACLAAASEADDTIVNNPYLMAGHSLGEYTALVASGVVGLSQAVHLVRERGRLMEEACKQQSGGMAAILGLDKASVEEVCRNTGVQMANINSPGQIVISGAQKQLKEAMHLAKEQGARKVIPLSVSGAFHSHLMGPAIGGMLKALDSVEFAHPVVPVIGNCTAMPLKAKREVKEELAEQLCGCVRWEECISYMLAEGTTSFIEFGPGRVLSGMVKQIDKDASVLSVNDLVSAQSLSERLSQN